MKNQEGRGKERMESGEIWNSIERLRRKIYRDGETQMFRFSPWGVLKCGCGFVVSA
jgi:hypothetical protein